MTMALISTTTVGSGGAASIDFTSIPSTYTDLFLIVCARSNYASTYNNMYCRVNNDSGANYTLRYLQGNGSSASSSSSTTLIGFGYISASGAGSNTFGNASLYFPNYAGSANKTASSEFVSEDSTSAQFQTISGGVWNNTAAITSINLSLAFSASFVEYSTASLYGILKGSGGATVS